jgi:hypothetical protein
VLVITVIFMSVILLVAGYAIDAGLWFVHNKHLQIQADSAALAAAQSYQFNCGATGDTLIANVVHQYDGTNLSTLGHAGTALPYNQQVPGPTAITPSKTPIAGHALYSAINQANFIGHPLNQLVPDDTGLTGSPCTDGVIDVKATEQGLPSYILPSFLSPGYVNAQARVGFQTEGVGSAQPFIEPIPTPAAVAVEFVNEMTGQVLSTPGVVTMSSSDGGLTWKATSAQIKYADPAAGGSTTDTFPVGMRVAANTAGGAANFTCTGTITCYDASTTPNLGVVFTRAWTISGTPGSPASAPVAPQAGHVWLEPCVTASSSCAACPSAPTATFSNFFASSTTFSEQLCASMNFTGTGGTTLSCSTASLTLTAGTTTVPITSCPTTGTPPNGVWSSGPITIPVNTGNMNLRLSWSLTAGNTPVGAQGGTSGKCGDGKGQNPAICTGALGTVQQAYSGAYGLLSGGASNSGPISSASVSDHTTGNEIQTVANGTTVNADIAVGFYGFQTESTVGGPPFELTLGGNQGNGDLACAGSSGQPQFFAAIQNGCPDPPGPYGITSVQPASTACAGNPTPPVCVNTNPGNGKSKDIDSGYNLKINGSKNAQSCVNPNYWTSPNTVAQILSQSPPDPRLVTLFYTDPGPLPGGTSAVPIRGFAEFYITGWGGNLDPCLSKADGGKGTTGINSTTGLSYTTDDLPPNGDDGVLMGHFVTYVNADGISSGQTCVKNSLSVCVPVLIK